MSRRVHHFTVDVEEYFHPTAVARHFPMDEWEGLPRRSPGVVRRLLGFLEERGVQGTFFVLGWLAEKEPAMVRAIAEAGHELASHGYEHALVGSLGPEGFRSSVRRSKRAVEDAAGVEVLGYRAPSFSIVPGLEWAFDVLLEEGYRYDASLFPITQHPTYGYPAAPPHPHWIDRSSGSLLEIPTTSAVILGRRVPAGGGAYFRLLPPALVRRGLDQAAADSYPGTFYIHPWELDDWKPSVDAPLLQRVRTFAGRRRCWRRLDHLLERYRFGAIRGTLERMAS